MGPRKVCIIGSGNWGSAIAKLVGENTASNPDLFVKDTPMWVFEEEVNGRKLTEIINTGKHLPQIITKIFNNHFQFYFLFQNTRM